VGIWIVLFVAALYLMVLTAMRIEGK